MRQRRHGLRLPLESRQRSWIGSDRYRQHFDGNVALQTRILRPPHLTHPAGANRRDDHVGTEATAYPDGHRPIARSPPMEACLAERSDFSDDLKISVSMEKQGVMIQRDLCDATVDRTSDGAAHTAQIEVGARCILPRPVAHLEVILCLQVGFQ
jgi:hypothetical protein